MGSTEGKRNDQVILGCCLENQLELARHDVVRLVYQLLHYRINKV